MYCTYVYVLKDGRIVAHGKTEEVITEAAAYLEGRGVRIVRGTH